MKAIRTHGVKCSECGEVLVSLYTHDFHYCKCLGTAVDGGRAYIRSTWREGIKPPKTVEVLLKPNNTFTMAPKKRTKAA